MEGADVAQLWRLSSQFAARGEELRRIGAVLGAQLAGAPWQGGDAGAFRSRWSSAYHPTLLQVCQALHDAAGVLARNADEQERASAGAGGALSPTTAAAARSVAGPPAGSTPQQVRDWWDSLGAAEQQALLHDHPELLGNLDGLPGAVRDAANRALLPGQLAAAEAYVAAHPDDAGAAQHLAGLQTLTRMLAEKPGYQLLLLDASGHPLKAAVANGDIDSATRLVVHVPGTTGNVAGMEGDMSRVNNLTVETLRQLHQHGDSSDRVVGINWMGYDAPDAILSDSRTSAAENAAWDNVQGLFGTGPGASESPYQILDQDGGDTQDALNSRWAHEGAPAFAHFGEGLRANGGADVRIVADAHSYGAAVAGGAAMQTDAYDALVTSGGPGTFATDASQLHLRDGLFVSEAQWRDQDYSGVVRSAGGVPYVDLGAAWHKVTDGGDFVPDIGAIDPQDRFGTDPSQLPGAHVFDDGPVGASAQHGPLVTPHGHSSYWDVATHSLYNDGAVVAGYPQAASYR